MKFVTDRSYAEPDKAARTRLEIANTIDVVQDGKVYIELINGPSCFARKAHWRNTRPGLDRASSAGW